MHGGCNLCALTDTGCRSSILCMQSRKESSTRPGRCDLAGSRQWMRTKALRSKSDATVLHGCRGRIPEGYQHDLARDSSP